LRYISVVSIRSATASSFDGYELATG
jgi:hypothetical protein